MSDGDVGARHWRRVAQLDDATVRENILAGYAAGKPFTPYVPTIALPPARCVVDFGCGLGRNFPYLATIARTVVGFDLPEMAERARALDLPNNVRVTSDIEDAFGGVDLVFASLVLQHLEPAVLEDVLSRTVRLRAPLYILTRARYDFGGSTLEHVARFHAVPECVLVDHDIETHTLREVGRVSGDDARALTAEQHLELLITPPKRSAVRDLARRFLRRR